MATDKIILFSYDKPNDLNYILNSSPGIWFLVLTPGVDIVVTDDNGNTGYYPYENDVQYQVFSAKCDGTDLAQVDSIDDCKAVDASFYYDGATTRIYMHLPDFEPPLGKTLLFGVGLGFANKVNSLGTYYNMQYWEPRISSVQSIKKSIDPLFFGVIKYQGGKITLINADGVFDDWKTRNLYGKATRILFGDDGDAYADFVRVHSGFIQNDERDFDTLAITVTDVRASLSQSIATNLLNQTDYPYLSDGNVDTPKPVVYGAVKNAPCICLNEEETTPSYYIFLFMDTEFNQASSITVYKTVDGVKTTLPPAAINYSTGTFTLTYAVANAVLGDISADITTPITNGVAIIKDLLYRYDGKNYLASFWDITEVDAAEVLSRDTNVYIDDDAKLSEVLGKVCEDIDARFFAHDTGKYTVRVFNANRAITRTILTDEWVDAPNITNSGDEYLTSCVIKYDHDIKDDTYKQIEYLDYYDTAFTRYKKAKTETFETNLPDVTAATDKAATIMAYSSDVKDIISRSIKLVNNDLEIADFVLASPLTRVGATPTYAVYEILALEKDLENEKLKISMRYVKVDPTANLEYAARVTVDGDFRVTSDGDTRYTILEV